MSFGQVVSDQKSQNQNYKIFKFFLILIFVYHFLPLSAMHIFTKNNLTKRSLPYFTIWHNKLERFTQANISWGHIFSHVWPFYEWAVSDQDL